MEHTDLYKDVDDSSCAHGALPKAHWVAFGIPLPQTATIGGIQTATIGGIRIKAVEQSQ